MRQLNVVVIGLSISSSWGNGHATTYRALLKKLHENGDKVSFFEWDAPWYAQHRDLPNPDFCELYLYSSPDELRDQYSTIILSADVVIIGSYVKKGVEIGDWVLKNSHTAVAFYDIDTPVTIAKMDKKDFEYIHPNQVQKYDLYLSFTGGPTLDILQTRFKSPNAKALYCSVDTDNYFPIELEKNYDLGYLGTYSADRQPPLEKMMFEAANEWEKGKFVVAGPQYPNTDKWPGNVEWVNHLPPTEHNDFYNSQRFTLNITRADMIKAGWSPSVRLFEAAAAGAPIISDYWEGLDDIFRINTEILVSTSGKDTLKYLKELGEKKRIKLAESALKRVLAEHTSSVRAEQLRDYLISILNSKSRKKAVA